MASTRELATFADYDGLWAALRARVDSLHISREGLDHLAGLPGGYSGKLLGLKKAKRLGITSFGLVLGALGCELVLVESPAAMAQLAGRLVETKPKHMRSGTVQFSLSKRHLNKIRVKGGTNSRSSMSTKASRDLARKAALTRFPTGRAAMIRAARLKAWETRRAKADAALDPAPSALSPLLLTGAPR